jgi:chromosome segregation protein
MYLKSLTISGFKSFATKSHMEFAPGVTAVVGPNGSGKSNVSDAIRWVLGEQSVKQLRGKKGHDLIFAGSDKRSKASLAEVTLVIDNNDRSAKIPHSEVALTRRIYTSGDSEYLLAGKPVRLIDVVTLLAEAGFGQSTYTVISQGMVDSLLTQSPSERKALFDEAVGVRAYYLKRDSSLRQLKSTEENLNQVRGILRELSPTLVSLGRAAKRAALRETVEADFQEKARAVYGSRLGELNRGIEDRTKTKSELEHDNERIEREIAAIEKDLSSGNESETSELESARSMLQNLGRKRDEATRELALIEGRLQAAREGGGGLERRALLEQITRLSQEQTKLIEEEKSLKKKAADKEKSEIIIDAERDRLKSRVTKLRSELEEALDGHNPTTEFAPMVREARAVLAEMKEGRGNLAEQFERLEGLLAQMESGLDSRLEADKLSTLRSELREGEHALSRVEQTLSESGQERAGVTSLLLGTQSRLRDLERESASLEQKASSIGSTENAELGYLEKEKLSSEKIFVEAEKSLREQEATITKLETGLKGEMERAAELRQSVSEKQGLLRSSVRELMDSEVELAKLETRRDDLKEEILRELGSKSLIDLPDRKLTSRQLEQADVDLRKLRVKLAEIGSIDPETTAEYNELKERHDFLAEQANDLEKAALDLGKVVKELEGLIQTQFQDRFHRIASEFSNYFAELFGGGKARIILEASDDGDLGIEIQATPPGKRLHEVATLSGGERALTSAALLSAILTVNPSPFVVLDEVDAAMDEANTLKFGKVLKSLSKKTQFILITHNRRTMELASVLYGVTMDETGASKIISLKLEEAEEVAIT